MTTPADTPTAYLTLQFLTWIGEAPRGYGEVMEAWRTSCPRLSIWEDTLREGLVEVSDGRGAMRERAVTLTDRGRELRSDAEKIPPAVVARLGMPIEELQSLHAALTRVIAATH